ncbi:MAG TPA: adenosylcobinamide-GDP ribazoletransferase [Gemmataceae bacterium]|nr:adenosylcobinamide-GDP ribazoletransferase [Gemmataceae bacterium]
MRSFLVTVAFLTVLPIRFREMPGAELVARSRFWYPVVGLLLGALLGGWTALLAGNVSPMLGSFLVLLLWVGITGALHIDGSCDLCDGLFGGATVEDRLRILRDPHVGVFGVVGGVLLLLAKFVLLVEILGSWQSVGVWPVVGAVCVARSLVLVVAAGAKYPRPDGTGKVLIEATRGWEAIVFTTIAALTSVASLGLGGWRLAHVPVALASILSALAAVLVLRWLCERRLGGITGDCLGAAIELAETVYLLAAIVLLPLFPGSGHLGLAT